MASPRTPCGWPPPSQCSSSAAMVDSVACGNPSWRATAAPRSQRMRMRSRVTCPRRAKAVKSDTRSRSRRPGPTARGGDGEVHRPVPVDALHPRLDRPIVRAEGSAHHRGVAGAAGVLEQERIVEREARGGASSSSSAKRIPITQVRMEWPGACPSVRSRACDSAASTSGSAAGDAAGDAARTIEFDVNGVECMSAVGAEPDAFVPVVPGARADAQTRMHASRRTTREYGATLRLSPPATPLAGPCCATAQYGASSRAWAGGPWRLGSGAARARPGAA